MAAPALDVSEGTLEVWEPAWLVTLARVEETPEAALLAPDAREEVRPDASEASDEVTDASAEEAELSTLERALLALEARLEARLEASLARLDVTLEAPLARLPVTLAPLSVAEAKADDKTPKAPVEMAVADVLADWAMEAQ